MAFQLNDFRNKFVNGGARPSQFEMQLTWPDAVRGLANITQAEADLRFFCAVSEIPGSTITNIPAPYFGRKLNYAGERTFEPLVLTVLNDEDFKIRKALEIWSRAITDMSTTVSIFAGGNAAGSYCTDGVVTQFSRNSGGRAVTSYKFVGMYPNILSKIALDWKTTDQFEEFTCTFQYQWWEVIDASSGAAVSINA